MTNEQDPKKFYLSKQVFDTLANADPKTGQRIGKALREISEDPFSDRPTIYTPEAVIKEPDFAGFAELKGQRIVGSYIEFEPTQWTPGPYFVAFLHVDDKLLYLQDLDLREIQRLGIPKYIADAELRLDRYKEMQLIFENVYEEGEGVVFQVKTGEKLENLHAKYYSLMPIPEKQEE